jgi:hypothetical protein
MDSVRYLRGDNDIPTELEKSISAVTNLFS